LSQLRDLQYPDGSRRMEESRTLMSWDDEQDQDLLRFYRDLIAARRGQSGLWRGERTTLAASDEGRYVVRIEREGRSAVVALNRGRTEQRLVVPAGAMVATDDGVRQTADGLTLPPLSGALVIG